MANLIFNKLITWLKRQLFRVSNDHMITLMWGPSSPRTLTQPLNAKLNGQINEQVEEVEKWYIAELCERVRKVRRKSIKPEIGSNKTKNGFYKGFLLTNFCKNAKDAQQIHIGFIRLKEAYCGIGKTKDALRMLQVAIVFGNLSSEELNWAFKTACSHALYDGFWVGEAAKDFTLNYVNPERDKILQMASNKGNKLAEFTLKCRTLI